MEHCGHRETKMLKILIKNYLSVAKSKSKEENEDTKLQRILLSCRVTQHSTTKTASSELLYHRTVVTYLKELPSNKLLNKHQEAKENI